MQADRAKGHWEHFSHVADLGIRGVGADMGKAFEQAALALTAAVTDVSTVRPDIAIDMTCDADDSDTLFYDWINTLVYEMAVRKMLFSRFQVKLSGTRLSARAWGEPVDRTRHEPAVEVKGATYTEVQVVRREDSWVAQCVIDV